MTPTELQLKIIAFFEAVEKYYGCKTEITEGLYSNSEDLEAHLTTWNLSEFELIRSAYRKNGGRFMFEGNTMYYEISGEKLIDFKQPGRNKFEFIEQYSETVFRITKIRFHYKY
jgi:type I site-specific restriction-modification system R (restriction) subunit